MAADGARGGGGGGEEGGIGSAGGDGGQGREVTEPETEPLMVQHVKVAVPSEEMYRAAPNCTEGEHKSVQRGAGGRVYEVSKCKCTEAATFSYTLV
ncbi:MAG: hypothetical protein ACPIOQ_85570, partial [Promethearchaeia archaeon]